MEEGRFPEPGTLDREDNKMQRTAFSLAILAWGSAGMTHAVAQQNPPDPAPATVLPKITVTGSNIPRIDNETASPTLILRREDIKRTGAGTVKELIDSLSGSSQLASGPNRVLSDITGSNSFAAGGSAASLRHLGPQATLVLLNSRRMAPFAMDDDPAMFVNLDTLPLDAVERVEILRSGASAIYGSDAVAGVINIITRSGYRGLQMRASQEQSTVSKDFRSSTAGLTAGFGDLVEDRYNVLVNVELYKRSGVLWREVIDKVNPQQTRYAPGFGSLSTFSNPGNVIDRDGVAHPVAGCPPTQLRNDVCYYDRYARLEAQPASQRANLLLSGELRIDATLKGFAEVLYSSNETRYTLTDPAYGAPTVQTWFDLASGQPRFFNERGLPKESPLNPTGEDGAEFRYRFSDANSRLTVKSDNYRVLTGLRGTHRGFDWETAIGAMGGTVENKVRGAYSDSGFRQLIGDYTLAHDPQFFNRGYRVGQPNSAAVLDTLFPTFSSYGKTTQTFLDGKASGPVGTWRGKPIDAAFGFDLRHESLSIQPSANFASGDIVGYGIAQTEGRRTFGSLFGELSIPLADKLELQTAARLDKYPGFDINLSPKVGLRFQPVQWMLMRGTVEGGFRAPNLTENSKSARYSYDSYVSDPKRCTQATALADALRTQANALPDTDPAKASTLARADIVTSQECGRGIATARTSNPDLQPEKSLAATAGLVFQPTANALASLDYWVIRRRNEIGYKTAQELINAEDNLPTGVVNRLPTGSPDPTFTNAERGTYGVTDNALAWTNSQTENTAKTYTSGVDLSLQSRTPTPLGVLTGGIQATYLLNYYTYSPLRGGYGDNLAGRYNYPRLRGALTVSLASRSFSNAFRLNVLSGTKLQGDFYDTFYSDQGCLDSGWNDCRVHSSSTVDYFLSYTGVRDLDIGLSVRNLLNRRPPVDLRALDEAGGGIIPPSLQDVQRRTVRLTLSYKFF